MNTFEEVDKFAEELLSRRTNDIYKLQVKSWVYHSKNRLRNGHEPFPFSVKTFDGNIILSYLMYNLIDVSDIGDGSIDYSKKAVYQWWAIKQE